MRDAFGGTFVMYMIAIFVVLFVTFMAETLKYVQAYRAKNAIINYIEQYEGFNTIVKEKIEGTESDPSSGYLARLSYNSKNAVTASGNLPTAAGQTYCSGDYGYCVTLEYFEAGHAYYKVSTYISLDFTNILSLGPLNIPISGETRLVTFDGVV